jgi:MFS family permease
MGFQFQALSSISPALIAETTISYTALGILIGAYMLPGVFIAIPGGWFGKRFGDKRVVLAGLTMMTAGGAVLVLSDSYGIMFAGRLVSGVGAVLLNVLVTKMVTDWFAGQRIVTSMGILISSWPLGIAIALLTMPLVTESAGLVWAFTLPVVACAVALLLVSVMYSSPNEQEGETLSHTKPVRNLTPYEFWGVVLSGAIWCLYNVAFILPLIFGPEFLSSRGTGLAAAGAIVSLTSWLIIPALPLGAWFAERIERPVTILVVSFAAPAIILLLIPITSSHVVMFAILGLTFGPAGGLIMALPAKVLREENRAVGIGIFYTVYYAGMGIFPAISGYIRDASGNPAAPLWFAGIILIVAMLVLLGFTIFVRRNQASELAL